MADRLDIMVQALRDRGAVFLLESQSADHPAGRYTYLAGSPRASIRAHGDEIQLEEGSEKQTFSSNPWKALGEFRSDRKGWMFGYLGYDLKNSLEDLSSENPDPVGAPDMYFMIPGVLIRIDRKTGELKPICGEVPEGVAPQPEKGFRVGQLQTAVDRNAYLQTIREAQERITEGSFYEINLSHQLHATFEGDSYELYRRMKKLGPVPFGVYAAFGEYALCCQSPERFLGRRGSRVFSQPIKGTIGRGEDPAADKILREKLKESIKEQAENLMIVDLVRNDLSRIARQGSVQVSGLFDIQTFDTVHQMVSTVEAETDMDDPIEIIKPCFPMGSMTGAPKISAMKAIEELETYRRNIYSGAVGYIDPKGDFDFNVVIRSAVIKNDRLYYAVGGAVTGDSDPVAEWEETLVKARALTGIL